MTTLVAMRAVAGICTHRRNAGACFVIACMSTEAMRRSDTAKHILTSRRKWLSAPVFPPGTSRAVSLQTISIALRKIEQLAGREFIAFVPPVLDRHFMMLRGIKSGCAGEHPPANQRAARQKRYTTEGIRRDLRKIQTAANRNDGHKVEAELNETTHTVRFWLARALVVEQNITAILQTPLPDIAAACSTTLASAALKKQGRGRRANDADDVLLLSVVNIYRELSGHPTARWIDFDDKASPLLQVLTLVFTLAGPRSPGPKMLKKRWAALAPKKGPPRRNLRFQPIAFGRKSS
jgi:hypothetical protein